MPATKTKPKMSIRQRNIYLYLTVAFFLALIAIFVFDGYMGIYDTVTITTAEREDIVEPEFWLRSDDQHGYYYTWAEEGQTVNFHYELENRCLRNYVAEVEVAVWFSDSRQNTLVSDALVVRSFDSAEWDWSLKTAALRPVEIPETQDFELSVIIKRNDVELRTIVHVASLESKY
jgi:hypothetical protein